MSKINIMDWLTQQQQTQQAIYLMLDPLAEPNPVATLLTNQAIISYEWLLHKTPYESLRYASPTIIQIADINNQGIKKLINHPEQNWGWFFTINPQVTMEQLITHWQARLTLIYEQQEVFYRFQDNRVIVRALKAIPNDQYFQLLGQINQVALWDENEWQIYTNEVPRDYALTTNENLIWALPEPANVVQQVRLENMFDWAINTFADDVFIQAKFGGVPFKDWLKEQLALLEKWQWPKEEQALFMIEQRLDYEQRQSSEWQPRPEETPQQHYERVKARFTKQLPRQPLCTTLDTTKL